MNNQLYILYYYFLSKKIEVATRAEDRDR